MMNPQAAIQAPSLPTAQMEDIVFARLSKDFEFSINGEDYIAPKGQTVVVNTELSCVSINEWTFHIDSDEYTIQEC